jgi:hypothetical protein
MQRDPQVDLIFSHFIPRDEATGVDPNDLRALMPRVIPTLTMIDRRLPNRGERWT